jgi:bacterial/archaeal transporter family protein
MSYTFFLLALAGIMVGLAQVVNKKLSHSGYDSRTYTSVITLISATISIPLLFYRFSLPSLPLTWVLVLFSILAFAFSTFFGFQAYKLTDVSIVAIIQRTSIVFIALLGIFILKEKYNFSSYLGLTLIFSSGILLTYTKKKAPINKGVIFALLMALTGSMASLLDKVILSDFSPFTYLFINNLLVGMVFSFNLERIKQAGELMKNHFSQILFTSCLSTGAFLIILVVLKDTDVSKTMPVYKSLGLITPVLLGILILKEKRQIPQKIGGIILGTIGIMLLYKSF